MDSAFMMKLAALALLAGFLLVRLWQRERRRAAVRRELHQGGEGLDVAPLRPRLTALRQNFLGVAHAHARGIQAREGLVAAARRKLCRLAFFHDQPAHTEGEHHAV